MGEPDSNPEKRIALFQQKEIRRVIHNNEWWFVIIDVVAALTDSANPKGYFTDMRRRDPQLVEALKGGQIATPPWSGVRHSRRTPDAAMLEHRRYETRFRKQTHTLSNFGNRNPIIAKAKCKDEKTFSCLDFTWLTPNNNYNF
jgi:hypothetical protein